LVFRLVGGAGEGGRADWFLAKLGLAALLSGNVMMFQSLTYFGALDSLGPEVLSTSSWIMFGCSVAVFALLGVPMLRVALHALWQGRMTLETLIGFGALAAIGFSATQTFRGGRALYYDSGTMLLVFVILGQYLDAEVRRRALALLAPTMNRARRQARVFRDGAEAYAAPASVQAGEIVHVRAGEEIPVDGTVIMGSADVSEPLLTGEWRPRLSSEGDGVRAGSFALDGALAVRASGVAEPIADRIARFAEEARSRRAPTEVIVDRVVAYFVPAVLLIAAASCCLWGLADQWQRGCQAALAVLVVACPCALGIATPLATSMASSLAMARGVLVRGGAVFELLSQVRVLAFDKTGTITLGRPEVVRYRQSAEARVGSGESMRLAAGVENAVDHPFARALVASTRAQGEPPPVASGVRVTPGGGAHGLVENHQIEVGKLSWLASRGIQLPPTITADRGSSSVGIAIDGCFAGEVLLDDPCRPEAREAILALNRMGLSCHLLSGDTRDVVERIAAAVGAADFAANLSPTDKPRCVQALRTSAGLVAMVGDGLNDAPALGAAQVGIAFGAAADLAKESADVIVLPEDLREIPRLLALARKTLGIVRQNLLWAFAYNVVAIFLAAFGLLRPIVAAAAMVLSSVCVVQNSMRLSRGQGGRSNTIGGVRS
jgi:Cu2+-exporting ATPase